MKRYELFGAIIESDRGELVKFTDAISEITKLENKIKTLETQLNKKHSLSGDQGD